MKTGSHWTSLNLFFGETAHLAKCILMFLDFNDSLKDIVPHDIIKAHAKLTKICLNDW